MALNATTITAALVTVLRTVTAANGYVSNVGASVRVGEVRGMATQAPACFVIPGRGGPGEARYGEARQVIREYEVRGFASVLDHPTISDYALVDTVIWDIRRAMESYEPAVDSLIQSLAYRGDRPGYREEGGNAVGAAVTYELTYLVTLTDPETVLTAL